jgi:ribosomal protein L37AE/L43A
MQGSEKPESLHKVSYAYMVGATKDSEGKIKIVKTHPDRVETITFEDIEEIELLLEELSEEWGERRCCPKCQSKMEPAYTKEYNCEECNEIFTEGYLDFFEAAKKANMLREQENRNPEK